MTPQTIRVVVADDHPLFLDALVDVLAAEPDLEVVATATDGEAALLAVAEHQPDVALFDIRMPRLDGLELLSQLTAEHSSASVLLVSGEATGATVHAAFAAGAAGYVSKDSAPEVLVAAVHVLADGGSFVGPEFYAQFADALREHRDDAQPALSDRELDVLRLAADGLAVPELARRLAISAATVKTHLTNAYAKLGVTDRAAAVAAAMRAGVLE